MTDDIVTRLRDCTCIPHGEICRETADEIERLRAEVSELRGWKGDALYSYQVCAMERDRLRAERDEARRDFCYCDDGWPLSDEQARQKANELGWDCFKDAQP